MSITSHAVRESRRNPTSVRSRYRRLVEGFAFIAVWVGLGYLFPSSSETYLLMGIPLTVAFQLLVRRRPLRELWVRDGGTGSGLSRRDVAVTALLVIAPAYWATKAFGGGNLPVIGWYAAAILGSGAAAYALRATSIRAVLRSAALPTAVGVLGNVIVVGGIQVASGTSIDLVELVGSVVKWTAIYFPVTFVIEEVAFRGALDSHVHHSGEGRGWQTAMFVSVLWGLWHLPVADGMSFPLLVLSLVVWHCAIGVPLSLAWRRSGNLSGPAFAHAAIDAVRNGVIGL